MPKTPAETLADHLATRYGLMLNDTCRKALIAEIEHIMTPPATVAVAPKKKRKSDAA